MKVLPLVLPKYETVPWFTSGLAVLYAYDPTVADMWVTHNCISVNFNTINNKPCGYYI